MCVCLRVTHRSSSASHGRRETESKLTKPSIDLPAICTYTPSIFSFSVFCPFYFSTDLFIRYTRVVGRHSFNRGDSVRPHEARRNTLDRVSIDPCLARFSTLCMYVKPDYIHVYLRRGFVFWDSFASWPCSSLIDTKVSPHSTQQTYSFFLSFSFFFSFLLFLFLSPPTTTSYTYIYLYVYYVYICIYVCAYTAINNKKKNF